MNRTHLLVVTFVVSIALLVSTAASLSSTGVDQLDGVEGVELAPANGSNGEFAVLNDDGEIEIRIGQRNPYVDIDGISGGTVRTVPAIFTVTNTGTTPVSVWITDDADALQYVRGEDGAESVEERANRVALDPSETVDVGLRIDARDQGGVERADSFVIHASRVETDRPPSDGAQASATLEPTDGPRPTPTPTPVDETPPSPTATDGDGPTAAPTDDLTNTPSETSTPDERAVSTPTPTVSAPPPETPQPPALDGDQPSTRGLGGVSSTVTGAVVALLALVAVVFALLRGAQRVS